MIMINVFYKILFGGVSTKNIERGVTVVGGVEIITFTELVMVVSGGQTKHLDNS